jgi:hypothetical protein
VLDVPVGGAERLLVEEVHVREGVARLRAAGEFEEHAVGRDGVAEAALARRRGRRDGQLYRGQRSRVRREPRAPDADRVVRGREKWEQLDADRAQAIGDAGRVRCGADVPERALRQRAVKVVAPRAGRRPIDPVEEEQHLGFDRGEPGDLTSSRCRPHPQIPRDRALGIDGVEADMVERRQLRPPLRLTRSMARRRNEKSDERQQDE